MRMSIFPSLLESWSYEVCDGVVGRDVKFCVADYAIVRGFNGEIVLLLLQLHK
jgi:hypothetical protein